jgi:hypothetical protein
MDIGGAMQVLIVYESIFGNTHQVAEAIAAGARDARPGTFADCVPVGDATPERIAAADLLVVGGPTHARGMSFSKSRMGAVQDAARPAKGKGVTHAVDPDAEGPGLRDWFHGLPKAQRGSRAAAFDTRLASPMAGGAARGIARRLHSRGYELATDPEGFIVTDAYGPMRAGELDRASAWGALLVVHTAPVA